MALVSEKIKNCGVKIVTKVKGVTGSGSGVLYVTSNRCKYNYVLTAKHLLQEDSKIPFNISHLNEIRIFYNSIGTLKFLQGFQISDMKTRVIDFKADLAIILIDKFQSIEFPQILVADQLEDDDGRFLAWSIFQANEDALHRFAFSRSDPENRRYKLTDNVCEDYLHGMSGAGIFADNSFKLCGIISRYPNTAFQNAAIDCVSISFDEVNFKLNELNLEQLTTELSSSKRQIKDEVVDLYQAYVNNTCLNLEKARLWLIADCEDDWYHDPLKYRDLLTREYIYEQLGEYLTGKKFVAQRAERFFVPKKRFTLRVAMVSPLIDRLLYTACVGVLMGCIEQSLLPNIYSARINSYGSGNMILNGVEQWKKLRYQLSQTAGLKFKTGNYKFAAVLKIDILNFYDNINKNLLIEKLNRVCKTENERNAVLFLREILFSLSEKDSGIPQNCDASALLATFYLNQVDTFMSNHASTYCRFMDDIHIFCETKYHARKLLQIFEAELRRCYLSVNSQKSQILTLVEELPDKNAEEFVSRSDFERIFDFQINQISVLRNSSSQVFKNEAFHLSLQVLQSTLNATNESSESHKRMNYALNTIAFLASKGFELTGKGSNFKTVLLKSIENLKDQPWMSPIVCKILCMIPSSDLKIYLSKISLLLLDTSINIYTFQGYHLWLLLAKHKWKKQKLTKFAIEEIEKNNDTNRPVVAAMLIYLSSVDKNYRRVVVRKLSEGFTRGYFECRLALISVRSFPTSIIEHQHLSAALLFAHKYTHRFADKDLVYIPGIESDENSSELETEQLFSL